MYEELYDLVIELKHLNIYPAIISEDVSKGPDFKELKVAWYLASSDNELMKSVMNLSGMDTSDITDGSNLLVEHTYTPKDDSDLEDLDEVLNAYGVSIKDIEDEVTYILDSHMYDVDKIVHHSFIIGMN